MNDLVESVYRTESRRVLATLIRLLGDFDLAEEACGRVHHDRRAVAARRGARQPARVAGVGRALPGHRHAAPAGARGGRAG
jgi:predicted RNA polymerase sigma factor